MENYKSPAGPLLCQNGDAVVDKVLVVHLVLLWDVLLCKLGQLHHLRDHLLLVVCVTQVDKGCHYTVQAVYVTGL